MTHDDVLGQYPEYRELQRLADLRNQGGWRFAGQHDVADEQAPFITGIRTWADGSADVLVVWDFTATNARRTNPAGGIVWKHQGCLGDVVDRLLALPAPGDPGAPAQVIGSGPGMWTSG